MNAIIKAGFCVLLFIFNTASAQQKAFVAPCDADTMRNPLKADATAAVKGQILYTKFCAACHGATGKGDGIASGVLPRLPADHTSSKVQDQSDGALFWKVFTGNAPMPAFRILPQEQIWQLVCYMRTLSTAKSVTASANK